MSWFRFSIGLPVPFEQFRNRIRLQRRVPWSGTADIAGTASAESSTAIVDAAVLGNYGDGALVGRFVRVTHANGEYEDRIVAGNSEGGMSILLDGALEAPCAIGDTYIVSDNFLWARFSRYFRRFTYGSGGGAEATARAQALPFDQDLETLFRQGLLWKAFAQGDANSPEATKAEQAFRQQMDRFFTALDVNGEVEPRNRPREIPPIYPS